MDAKAPASQRTRSRIADLAGADHEHERHFVLPTRQGRVESRDLRRGSRDDEHAVPGNGGLRHRRTKSAPLPESHHAQPRLLPQPRVADALADERRVVRR